MTRRNERNEALKESVDKKSYLPEDHTFAICAYGQSAFIEDCIRSLKEQKLKSNIIMTTSTPSEFLESIAEKYGLILHINEEKVFKSNIAADWNYAVKKAGTKLVTIAHQDDIYKPDYACRVMEGLNRAEHPLIAFTDYAELRNGREISNIRNLKIKRMMLLPLRSGKLWGSVFIRRRMLSMGSPICCPSVTYVRPNLPEQLFVPGYKVNLDWQAWERFSRLNGDFVFVNDILMTHRIHNESETSRNIEDNNRTAEDLDMFRKFWPERIARIIEHWYRKSEDQNNLG